MSNGPPKKTKIRRFAKVLGLVVLLVIGLVWFPNIKAGNTPLHLAARNNSTKTAQLLITWGANVNAKNSEEATPLHWAAAENATKTANLLLTQGAEICAKDTLGLTPLHWAAGNNTAETAELLNRYGGRE